MVVSVTTITAESEGNKMRSNEYKGYLIRPIPGNPHSLTIAVAGKGGKIPRVMEGMFTDRTTAQRVVDLYLDSKGA